MVERLSVSMKWLVRLTVNPLLVSRPLADFHRRPASGEAKCLSDLDLHSRRSDRLF